MLCIKHIKEGVISIAVFFAAINISLAQSYYHSPNDTIVANAAFNDVSVFNIIQIHPTADTLYFRWNQQSVLMPATWEASICDVGHCYTTLQDTGMTDAIVTGNNGLISLHINPMFEAGTGIIRYSLFATSTPAQIDTLTWIITATPPSGVGISICTSHKPIVVYNNKQILCKNLNGNFSKVVLYGLTGKLLLEKNIESEEVTLSTEEYCPQLLLLQLIGKQIVTNKIFNY